jgi:hypothetical protein
MALPTDRRPEDLYPGKCRSEVGYMARTSSWDLHAQLAAALRRALGTASALKP